jgi:DMSO/TMAO reductase YedYZ molybdopterin-dependent catalytic subunit
MQTLKNIEHRGFSRRLFFKIITLAGAWLAFPTKLYAFFIDRLPVRTVDRDDFNFSPETGYIEWKGKGKKEAFYLTITGLAEKPVGITYKELLALPRATQTSDFHCVEGWSVPDLKWGGIRFDVLFAKVKLRANAKYVIFHSMGTTESTPQGQAHYVESFPLGELLDPGKQCLLALTLDDKPLTKEHGAPLRVIAPFSLGYKSIKYVRIIEFSEHAKPGWWTLANPAYPVDAPVPKSRLR